MYRDNLKGAAFWKSPRKAITLLGMSGVGKTTLASRLPRQTWFHYSGDTELGRVILMNLYWITSSARL